MAQASPFSPWQLLKKSESWAEKRCERWQACPTKQRDSTAPSLTQAPELMMKSCAVTLAPMVTGASGQLLMVPLSRREAPSMRQASPMQRLRIVPVLTICTPRPMVPQSLVTVAV